MELLGVFAVLVWSCVILVSANGQTCMPIDRLQAVQQSYKIEENRAMFGLLGACPPLGEQLDESLRYQIINEEHVPGITLLNSETGEFKFEPAPNWIGVVSFTYRVSDGHDHHGGVSPPAKVTILVKSYPEETPLLEADNIRAVEGTYVPMGIRIYEEENSGQDRHVTVSLCNCDEALTCSRQAGSCSCLLTLPEGWVLADGLQRQLFNNELTNLSPSQLQNLTLKTQVNSNGHHCLDVHVVNWEVETDEPLTAKHKLLITIDPSPAIPLITRGSTSHNALQLETREGQVIRFRALHVQDSDYAKGMYHVRVSVDQGGTLWVKQAGRLDVIFRPKEEYNQEWEGSDDDQEYRRLDRLGNFYQTYQMHDTQSSNNGKKDLIFVGSLDGINQALKRMVYVPWCPKWPTPPNWNLPEHTWMEPSIYDQLQVDEDPLKPNIWPQWYPRFWYPFPSKHWTWWPRVLPPWWINQTCSDWTSHIYMEIREITPNTCDEEKDHDVVHWYADVHVTARGSEPKSLIANNLFNYFPSTAQSFRLKNLYLRSKEETFQLRFTLNVLENQEATIINTDTGKPSFTCTNVTECNDQLEKIQVQLRENVADVCKVTIEIRMYKDDSDSLSDYIMLWAYKALPECIPINSTTIEPPQEQMTTMQGDTVPLDLRTSSSAQPGQSGILHTVIYAEHGLVTVSAPDGLRVYMDHMGQHEHIPTYLCISGPTDMVLEALTSAKLTLLKHFKGQTTVTIDYSVPFTALQKTYNTNKRPPMRRAVVNINVLERERHAIFPLIVMPSKVCMSENDLLPLDMIQLSGMDTKDDRFNLSLVALKGRLMVEPLRISEIYECPEQTVTGATDDMKSMCTEECSFHTACPGTQMCCHQGCDRVCIEPQQAATIESPNTQSINIEGKMSTINRVLEAENLWYMAKPCQTDDLGEIVTDRVIETQEDAIRIEVKHPGKPDGDSVFHTLFVNISCMSYSVVGRLEVRHAVLHHKGTYSTRGEAEGHNEEASAPECHEVWGAWNDCRLLQGVCGQGTQIRLGQCGQQLLRQERPCMICGCQPVEETLVAPSCTSLYPVKRCPPGCSVHFHHLEMLSFTCTNSVDSSEGGIAEPDPQDPIVIQKTKTIEVHDSCICDACQTDA